MIDAPPSCPFCQSPDVEVVSTWGGQLITRQLRCRTCHTYFEALRSELNSAEAGPSTSS